MWVFSQRIFGISISSCKEEGGQDMAFGGGEGDRTYADLATDIVQDDAPGLVDDLGFLLSSMVCLYRPMSVHVLPKDYEELTQRMILRSPYCPISEPSVTMTSLPASSTTASEHVASNPMPCTRAAMSSADDCYSQR
jgi:hypothetical protein